MTNILVELRKTKHEVLRQPISNLTLEALINLCQAYLVLGMEANADEVQKRIDHYTQILSG